MMMTSRFVRVAVAVVLCFFIVTVGILWLFHTGEKGNIRFLISPHHLLTAEAMDEWYRGIFTRSPDVTQVILISPSHFYPTGQYAMTAPLFSRLCWQRTCGELVSMPWLPVDERIFTLSGRNIATIEHGIGAPMVFITKHAPKALITPITLQRRLDTPMENEVLAREILHFALQKTGTTLIIGSVDFSHHVPELLARYHDLSSIAAMDALDTSRAEVDCRNCLDLVARMAHQSGKQYFHLFRRTSVDSILWKNTWFDNTSHIMGEFLSQSAPKIRITGIAFWDTSLPGQSFSGVDFSRFLRAFWQQGFPEKQPPAFYHSALLGFDIVSANLENALSETVCPPLKWPFHRQASPSSLVWLQRIGIIHLSLANNHSGDCGASQKTAEFVRAEGMKARLHGEVERSEIRWVHLSYVTLNAVENSLWSLTGAAALVRSEKWDGMSVIVEIHAGREYASSPSDDQRRIGRALVDAWADLVIMHHTHTLLGAEEYQGKKIYYGLGNFIFDQNLPNTLTWGAVVYSIDGNGSVESQLLIIPRRMDFSVSLSTDWIVAP